MNNKPKEYVDYSSGLLAIIAGFIVGTYASWLAIAVSLGLVLLSQYIKKYEYDKMYEMGREDARNTWKFLTPTSDFTNTTKNK